MTSPTASRQASARARPMTKGAQADSAVFTAPPPGAARQAPNGGRTTSGSGTASAAPSRQWHGNTAVATQPARMGCVFIGLCVCSYVYLTAIGEQGCHSRPLNDRRSTRFTGFVHEPTILAFSVVFFLLMAPRQPQPTRHMPLDHNCA